MIPIKYIITGLLGVAVLASSCKKWLTVKPRTEMTGDEMYSTESGFEDALTGVYIQLKSDQLYGKAMTYGSIERLVSSWDVTTNSTEERLGLFNYADEGVQNVLASIFGEEYKVIASINAILDRIDIQKEVFSSPDMYKVIKSECLALRAYCHFDLLRLFGPIPTNIPEGTVLPYVKTLSKIPNPHVSYDQFKAAMMQDLADAEMLVKDMDPFITYSQTDLSRPGQSAYTTFNPESNYSAYRFIRMNYYAVKALQARAYLWFGNKGKAYESAMVVINAKNPNGAPKFALGTLASYNSGDMNLFSEQIFGLYDFNLKTRYENDFLSGNIKKGTSESMVKLQLYGFSGVDIREIALWELVTLPSQSKAYIIKKYSVSSSPDPTNLGKFMIPMLRLSEMYLIAAESASDDRAQVLWNEFRIARNLQAATLPGDPVQLQRELVKEYRKEFFAEGQAFFAYKRTNAVKADIIWAPIASVPNYLIPLPLTEFAQ